MGRIFRSCVANRSENSEYPIFDALEIIARPRSMFSIHDLSRLLYISFLLLIGEKLIFVEDEIIIV